MPLKRNPYEVLGFDPAYPHEITDGAIKTRFRVLARKHHPDIGGNTEAFEELRAAADLLLDPERRRKFDLTGEISEREPDNAQAAILAMLGGVMMECVSEFATRGGNPRCNNMIELMRFVIERNRQKRNAEVRQMKAMIVAFQAISERAEAGTHTEAAYDPVGEIARTHAASVEKDLARDAMLTATENEVLKILSRYRYHTDAMPSSPSKAPGKFFSAI